MPRISDQRDNYRLVGVQLNVGSIFAHAADVENTAGSVPYGFELEWSKRRLEEKTWKSCHCYPTTGFFAGYTNYDNAVLGHGIHAAYFIEHRFMPFKNWSPVLRGAAGLIYSNRPYDDEENPENQSYSLPVNVFLQMQFGLNVAVSEKSVLMLKLGYNHLSNGGIREPNKGVNWPHITAGYLHRLNYMHPPRREKQGLGLDDQRWIKRIELFGAYTTRVYEQKEAFFAFGTMGTLARKLSELHTISVAGEWHYHQEHERRIERNNSDVSAHRAGILLGHDFLFGRVVFSQQLGVYVFDPFEYYDAIYHRWSVAYLHQSGVSLGISLKAHRHIAEFVDVRLGWSW